MIYLWINLGVLKGFAFFTIAQCGCGLFLALVFGLGHNGMATYDADVRPDFWKLQVIFHGVYLETGEQDGQNLLLDKSVEKAIIDLCRLRFYSGRTLM